MIEFANGSRLVESVTEFPNLAGAERIFADWETTSRDRKIRSVNPWHNCWPLGLAITVDEAYGAWYFPLQHIQTRFNLPLEAVQTWFFDVLMQGKEWINHNIKYDLHVTANGFGINPLDLNHLTYTCTLDWAKLIHSDRLQFSLDKLSKDWLGEDISRFEDAFTPYLKKPNGKYFNRDYGEIPADLMGEYAGQDVVTVRRLWKYICSKMPPESWEVAKTSQQLQKTFLRMERNGLPIVPNNVKARRVISLQRRVNLQNQVAEKTGVTLDPASNKDLNEYLCQGLGLPVLKWTNENDKTGKKPKNPSFDKHALKAYKALPNAPRSALQDMLDFRFEKTLDDVFLKPFLELEIDGLLHSSYTPTVRTGRSACKQPNSQQQSKASKEQVEVSEDEVIIVADYSQIEYRLMVHYIQDPVALQAYAADPWMDYHQFTADRDSIPRSQGKTINFLIGFGGGKKRTLSELMKNEELVAELLMQVEAMQLDDKTARDVFNARAMQKALEVFNNYHANIPGLKPLSKRVEQVAKARGYVRNLYGRRRHLKADHAYRGFNTLNQGSAADLMKERLVALDLWLQHFVPEARLIATVHDSVVIIVPKHLNTLELRCAICCILEDVQVPGGLTVPIRTDIGFGQNWRSADEQSKKLDFSRNSFSFGVYECR